MDSVTLRRVQLAQLEIAKELRSACEKIGVKFFLSCGTLLGAVRHKGFIPWDDDMDFGMLRSDYEKFIKEAPGVLGKDYFLQTWDSDPDFGYPFAKLRRLGTKYVEAISEGSSEHCELFIDIFPYDKIPNDAKIIAKTRRKLKLFYNILFMKTGLKPWARESAFLGRMKQRIKYFPMRVLGLLYSKRGLKKRLTALACKYTDTDAEFCYDQWGHEVIKYLYPTELFTSVKDAEFEEEIFPVPQGDIRMLEINYGDYMQLPPEDERENRHQVLEISI